MQITTCSPDKLHCFSTLDMPNAETEGQEGLEAQAPMATFPRCIHRHGNTAKPAMLSM